MNEIEVLKAANRGANARIRDLEITLSIIRECGGHFVDAERDIAGRLLRERDGDEFVVKLHDGRTFRTKSTKDAVECCKRQAAIPDSQWSHYRADPGNRPAHSTKGAGDPAGMSAGELISEGIRRGDLNRSFQS